MLLISPTRSTTKELALIDDEICLLLKRNDQRMLGGCLMLDTEHTLVESKYTVREPGLEG